MHSGWEAMQKVIANKTLWHYTVFLFAITLHGFPSSLVPRPLIQRVYRLQYNMRNTGSDPCWGWFGSGTETKLTNTDVCLLQCGGSTTRKKPTKGGHLSHVDSISEYH